MEEEGTRLMPMEMKSNKTIYLTEAQFKLMLEAVGRDLVLYHGSPADFDSFDLSFLGSGWAQQTYGYGIYLTDDKKAAEGYSQGGYVYTVRVNGTRRFLTYSKDINKQEATRIARNFYNYYLKTEYGKEAYKGYESEFWENECKYIAEAVDGGDVYGTIANILGDDKEASEFLHGLGYTGLIWKDKSITNYVVFSDRDVEIIDKTKVN